MYEVMFCPSVAGTSTWCWGPVPIPLRRNREARTCQESHEARSTSVSGVGEIFTTHEAHRQPQSTAITHSTAA